MTGRAARSPLPWLGGLLIVYLAVPVGAFVIRFAGSGDRGFNTPGLAGAVRTSVTTATISTALITLLGVPLAFLLARSRGRLGTLAGVVVQLPLALPPLMSGILLIYLVGPYTTLGRLFHGGLTDSAAGIVLAQAFVSSPFLIIAARSAFTALDPALEEVAATLRHRPLARFLRVSVPAAASGIGAGVLLAWLRSFGEYGATVLLAYHPFSLPVYTEVQFGGTGLPVTQAPTMVSLVLAAVAVVVASGRLHTRRSRRGRPSSAGAGVASRAPMPASATPVSFDLDVMAGSFHLAVAHQSHSHRLAIVGPSGSGKSMTLRSLAGLLGDHAGAVSLGDRRVDAVPPERRRVGYVPQSACLFPRKTVWQQVTFGATADPALAAWWLGILHLDGLEDRLPGELSGGQRQRVSLALALSGGPEVVLLDEPFSALDAPVREELRREVRRLQLCKGLSTVLVTHDPEEAAMLADEILVISGGKVLQAGMREEVFARPATPEVAQLLGMQNLNTAAAASDDTLTTGTEGLRIATGRHGVRTGGAVVWCVRPEHVDVAGEPGGGAGRQPSGTEQPGGGAQAAGWYPAQVVDVASLGTATAITVCLDGATELVARAPRHPAVVTGDYCRVRIDPADVLVWPSETESA